jgi:hypothetical membrane protein
MHRNEIAESVALVLRDWITLACAPMGCIAFVALYIVAAFADPDYVLFESYLSDLGVGPGAWAFNSGAVLSGSLLAAFAAGGFLSYLGTNRLMKIGAGLLAVSGMFLAGVGIFTEDAGDVHLLVSYAFFVAAFLSFGLFAAARFLVSRSLADVFLLVNACTFAIGLMVVVLFGPDPMAETIAVFSLLAWGVVITVIVAVEGGHGQLTNCLERPVKDF